MANIRDRERDFYIYQERNKGRTLKSIADELGIGAERVRQIYFRADGDINRRYRAKIYNPNLTQAEREELYRKEWGIKGR